MQHSTATPNVFPEPILPRLPSGKIDVATWIKQQGVVPIQDPDQLASGFWPDDESADALNSARREWRQEGRSGIVP